MISSIATVVMTVIMAWGTFTNPVVSQTHYRISDPFTGEVIEEVGP